jgi:hypothetical protein
MSGMWEGCWGEIFNEAKESRNSAIIGYSSSWSRQMSTIKNPKEKKLLSLKNDRRNVYGECPTSSRKNIALAKQRSHQQERHTVAEALRSQLGSSSGLDGDEVGATVKNRSIVSRRKSFKKWPDAPLADVLFRRKTGAYPKVAATTVSKTTLNALRKKS